MTRSACFLLWLGLTCPCMALSPVAMSPPTPIINQANAPQNCLCGNLLEAFSHEFSDVFRFVSCWQNQSAHKISHSSSNAYFPPSFCSAFSPHSHCKAVWKPQVISTPQPGHHAILKAPSPIKVVFFWVLKLCLSPSSLLLVCVLVCICMYVCKLEKNFVEPVLSFHLYVCSR